MSVIHVLNCVELCTYTYMYIQCNNNFYLFHKNRELYILRHSKSSTIILPKTAWFKALLKDK